MKTLIFIFLLVLIGAGCKKTNIGPYQSQGTLTGYDREMCPFCGGIDITIANDTSKNPRSFYRIDKTLQQLGISESTKFPINVSLNWTHDTRLGAGSYIIVSQIKAL
ncbi:hypothetical protein [Mucilaginibacter sp. FT3.2]|uniref:hypothetical protein n=1 Tax=Mucilaginibacter sp. FT3.2 TaxID=2723090 RepID=UPI0016078058|nr:hypothetical protein [Mucilaginibacter sp. FT3.2]MBB6232994.1 PBP1b-binding outer membrane lipoprotein LpoB [Mucilaginibacter sp. FT3.2]